MLSLIKTWIYPPLAFARVGGSSTPMDCFDWGPNDDSPRGSGKTTIVPMETLDLDAQGNVSSRLSHEVVFKDVVAGREKFRPVCPWFELHGRWQDNGSIMEGPITAELLARLGISIASLRWTIAGASKKAFNMTLKRGDIVSYSVTIGGADTARVPLLAFSDQATDSPPLVLESRPLACGAVQLSRPSPEFPELRLRFWAPTGALFAPSDISERIDAFLARFPQVQQDSDWRQLAIPSPFRILNKDAAWPNWVLRPGEDRRTMPVDQFAYLIAPDGANHSLGLMDDFTDGLITCTIPASPQRGELTANARVVVTPPDFAPDRRHLVSLADTLKDRTERDIATLYASLSLDEMTEDVQDLFQRIWETMELINVDAMNTKAGFDTPYHAQPSTNPLPLTVHARRAHRRLTARDALVDLFRERAGRVGVGTIPNYPAPRSFEDLINAPPNADGSEAAGNSYRKMPAVMRGPDGRPMHLTRRQYELLRLWVERLNQQGGGSNA